ncbi:MAG TPA: hypothetical protein VFJ51_04200, partial [Nitrososphaeraceae archaeon]|nr:hypothetical protein [Nitrososphaeraceae archaeon]
NDNVREYYATTNLISKFGCTCQYLSEQAKLWEYIIYYSLTLKCQSATTDRHNMFLCSLNNPSGTFIGDVVTMEEVLNYSNKILSSVMMMPLSGSNNQEGSLHHHLGVR